MQDEKAIFFVLFHRPPSEARRVIYKATVSALCPPHVDCISRPDHLVHAVQHYVERDCLVAFILNVGFVFGSERLRNSAS